MMTWRDFYTSGAAYKEHNPTVHEEDATWKARHILRLLNAEGLTPATVAEVGCGAGGILRALHAALPAASFTGYDIAPAAIQMAEKKGTDARLTFRCADLLDETCARFDLLLLIDLIEHLEDYFVFLRSVRKKASYTILHIPLDLSVSAILRGTLLEPRRTVGHIHYFTRDLALEVLQEVGYEIVRSFYTAGALEMPSRRWQTRAAWLPRKALAAVNTGLASRLLGGFSLMVLAR
jgi:cyclopropane fatty-acyl-phospholipid synthase-like methyltransferase